MLRVHATAPLIPALALVAGACGAGPAAETGDTGESEGEPDPACGRLQVFVDGGCESVEVVAVQARELAFERGGWSLQGTLRVPLAQPDYLAPGVVIVHGSGPGSRDGLQSNSLGVAYSEPIPVYRSLAEQLAARGFAVLTYDKRGCFVEQVPECAASVAAYPGDPGAITVVDYLEDARAAAQALAAEPEVADDVLLVGHSQGAGFVAILAAQEPVIRGAVMLAGATLPLPETLEGQYDDLADYLEAQDPDDPQIAELREQADAVRAALDSIAAGTYPEPSYEGASVEYWQSWIELQAGVDEAILALDEPLAGFYGTFDFNVGAAHFAQLHQWKLDGLSDATLNTYVDLTHAFVYVIDEPPGHTLEFSPEVVDDLVSWASQKP